MKIKQLNDSLVWHERASLSFAIEKEKSYTIRWCNPYGDQTVSNVNHGSRIRFNFTYGVNNENNDSLPF